ncbi:NifU family protein [Megasphaera hutchinsoni]|uniref:NifU-like protein n=1 Tax=Megasphaera hutchinsoni TaxID=1588748 RepID=A0A134CJF5_9FIRM|nr:NifU family protein [Megasphaera hutchinsoni]KXB92338.1 NifU-like protein [Megasphaera hutchinsoni]
MPTLTQLESLFNEKIRPSLQSHGGNVEIISYENNHLHIRLTGQCSGCPSALITTEELITQTVQEHFPEIKRVQLAFGVSASLIETAKQMLQKSKGAKHS